MIASCAFRAGRASSLKSTHSLSSLSVGTPTTTPTAKKEVGSSPVITEPRNLMHDDQFNMIPGTNIKILDIYKFSRGKISNKYIKDDLRH